MTTDPRADPDMTAATTATATATAATAMAAEAVLERRARALARPVGRLAESEYGSEAGVEVAVFRLADERYALETRFVRRVVRLPTPTPVPGTPGHFVGLVNLHGEILAVFDLRPLLGLARPAATDRTRVLVLGADGDEFGVLVDAAEGVVRLRPEEVFSCHGGGEGLAGAAARGVTRDALSVLDGAALMSDPRLTIDPNDGETGGDS